MYDASYMKRQVSLHIKCVTNSTNKWRRVEKRTQLTLMEGEYANHCASAANAYNEKTVKR